MRMLPCSSAACLYSALGLLMLAEGKGCFVCSHAIGSVRRLAGTQRGGAGDAVANRWLPATAVGSPSRIGAVSMVERIPP